MHPVTRPPLPSRQELDRIAPRYIVVPLALWAAGVLAIVLSASAPPAAEATAGSPDAGASTVAYGA
jgi:hypothetical protein